MGEEVEHVSLDPCQSSGAGTSQTGFVDDLDRVADPISSASVTFPFSHDDNAERSPSHNALGREIRRRKGLQRQRAVRPTSRGRRNGGEAI